MCTLQNKHPYVISHWKLFLNYVHSTSTSCELSIISCLSRFPRELGTEDLETALEDLEREDAVWGV